MTYDVVGGNLPVLKIKLNAGEYVECQAGAMSWMDDEIQMNTELGGAKQVFGRILNNETIALNKYVANQPGEIAFASSFPGSIVAIRVEPGRTIVAQKSAFLAQVGQIQQSVFFNKKLGAGLFGGEGFIMNKYEGNGIVFLEVDGSAESYNLEPGNRKILDTGHLVMMDATCSMDIQMVRGVKNFFLGGEGLFNTIVTGPGQIVVQSMPIARTATRLYGLMPHDSNSGGGINIKF